MKKIVGVCFLLVVLMSGNNVFAGFVSGDYNLQDGDIFVINPDGSVWLFSGVIPEGATHGISGGCSWVEVGIIPDVAKSFSVDVREGGEWVKWLDIDTSFNNFSGINLLLICVKSKPSVKSYFKVNLEIPIDGVLPSMMLILNKK